MDEVRNEVVEEAMTEKIKLKQSGQHKDLQEFLGIDTDGIFGKGTEKAVKKYQKENNRVILLIRKSFSGSPIHVYV